MLQVIMGADDHTASGGAYLRAIKARKWLYLATGICALLAHRLYRQDAALEMLKVVELPYWFVSQAAGIGLTYLAVQYGLLLIQVQSVYDLELEERFAEKLKTEREAASNAVDGASSGLKSIDREIARIELQMSDTQGGHLPPSDVASLKSQLDANQANRANAAQVLDAATSRLLSVEIRDPAKRTRFVQSEKLIDYLRLSAPILIALSVLALLIAAQF